MAAISLQPAISSLHMDSGLSHVTVDLSKCEQAETYKVLGHLGSYHVNEPKLPFQKMKVTWKGTAEPWLRAARHQTWEWCEWNQPVSSATSQPPADSKPTAESINFSWHSSDQQNCEQIRWLYFRPLGVGVVCYARRDNLIDSIKLTKIHHRNLEGKKQTSR